MRARIDARAEIQPETYRMYIDGQEVTKTHNSNEIKWLAEAIAQDTGRRVEIATHTNDCVYWSKVS
jgi:hypothetical protein